MQRLMSGIATIVVAVAAVTAFERPARADGINAYSYGDWLFGLPEIGKQWEQEKKTNLILISDESDTLPDLTIAVFPPSKEGALADIEARLQTELARPEIVFFGEKVKTFKIDKVATETISTTPMRVGSATLNGHKAAFALGQRGGKTLILVGVGNEGVEQRALANFLATVRKLAAPTKSAAQKGADHAPPPSEGALKLRDFVAVKDVTATSTFVDKSKKDLYGAWRTVSYETTTDELGAPKTAWCEGKPDEGIGEGITVNLAAPTKLDTIAIAAGVWLNPKLYGANNQITSLSVSFDGGAAVKVAPTATREWLVVKVGKAVSSIAIKIDAVKKGKMNDTCISGVALKRGADPLPVLVGIDAAAAAALPGAYRAIWEAIGTAALEKHVAFPFTYDNSNWFAEGSAQKAVTFKNWKALAAACKAKKPGCPSGPNYSETRAEEGVDFASTGKGTVTLLFPSSRETIDEWNLAWTNGAWKLTSIGYSAGSGGM